MSSHDRDTENPPFPDRLKGFQTISAPNAVLTEVYLCQNMSDFTNSATYPNRSEYIHQFSNEDLLISYNDALIEPMGKYMTVDVLKHVAGNYESQNSFTQVKFVMW